MTNLCEMVLRTLGDKTLVTAESCTGGMIGSLLTAIPGSSRVYKGGIISYTNQVKEAQLGVPADMLAKFGAVSQPVAVAMATGAMKKLGADIAISVTGLASPDGDDFGTPVGTVVIGYADANISFARKFRFEGNRQQVRVAAAEQALRIVLEMNM
jgi:PncC family amidohydrolase